jgi:hypothetical protein
MNSVLGLDYELTAFKYSIEAEDILYENSV